MRDRLAARHLDRLRQSLSNVKVVYTDLDNTLLGPDSSLFMMPDRRYSLETAGALLKLLSKKIDVVMISGRNNGQLRAIARLLGLTTYVAELGCMIYYNQGREAVANHSFELSPGANLHGDIAAGGGPALLLDRLSGRLEYHEPWSGDQECTHLFRGLIDVEEANALLKECGFDNLRIVDNGVIRSSGTLVGLPEVHAYHLLPKGAGKASAILADRRRRGFSTNETIALGDSLADLEMAAVVGEFFLVTDAPGINDRLDNALRGYENVYLTSEKMGLGWLEVANILLDSSTD
jgi:phosphoglycolate phosphatase